MSTRFTKDYIDGWLDAAQWIANTIEQLPTDRPFPDGNPYIDKTQVLQAIEDEAEIMAK